MYLLNLLKFKIKAYYIGFIGNFIKNKTLKNRFKSLERYKNSNNFVKKLKWGVSYSVFDGEELLESSLKSVRNSADYINVVYQTKSWYGNNCSKKLFSTLTDLKNKGLIDELIEYTPNHEKSAGVQEVEKRNLGLKYAKKAHCDFFMTMDCDEFYFEDEMKNSKIFIVNHDITNAFCKQIMYISPSQQLIDMKLCYVALWSKINIFSQLKRLKNFIILIDPTRIITRKFNFKPYIFNDINMHHYSYIRKNISLKCKNSSNTELHSLDFKNLKNKVSSIDVENYFNINIDIND